MFCVFSWIFENNCHRGGVFSTIFLSHGSGFCPFFVPQGLGNSPFQKIPWGFAWGELSGMELTDPLLPAINTLGKIYPIFHWPVIFSKFDKCDVISNLHKVTGQFFNRPIAMARWS